MGLMDMFSHKKENPDKQSFNPELFNKIRDIISKELEIEDSQTIIPQTDIIKDLSADSLDVIEIVMELEEKFNLEIPDEDTEKIFTVLDLVKYIENRLQKG